MSKLGIGLKRDIKHPLTRSNPYYWYVFAILIVAADQLTKYIAVNELVLDQFGERVVDVLPFLSFRFACNTGAAFSILQDLNYWLAAVGVLLSAYFGYLIYRLRISQRLEGTAFSLILAGALGNFIDRISHGCVIDFIHVHYGSFNFPIFNLADSSITVGVSVWILALVLEWRRERENESTSE